MCATGLNGREEIKKCVCKLNGIEGIKTCVVWNEYKLMCVCVEGKGVWMNVGKDFGGK